LATGTGDTASNPWQCSRADRVRDVSRSVNYPLPAALPGGTGFATME
jgi:hypothetical protein